MTTVGDLSASGAREGCSALWHRFETHCNVNGFRRERDEVCNAFYQYLGTLDGVRRGGLTFIGIGLLLPSAESDAMFHESEML